MLTHITIELPSVTPPGGETFPAERIWYKNQPILRKYFHDITKEDIRNAYRSLQGERTFKVRYRLQKYYNGMAATAYADSDAEPEEKEETYNRGLTKASEIGNKTDDEESDISRKEEFMSQESYTPSEPSKDNDE